MRNYKKRAYSLPHSFGFALHGVLQALRSERNLRIHFAAGAYVLYFSRYYSLSRGEYALLLLAVGLVVVCEMLNTAIEATVDIETPVYNPLAKTAKDVAAGAVMVAALTSVGVAFFLFWSPPTLLVIWRDVQGHLLLWLLLLALTVFWIALPQVHIANTIKRNGG